METLAVASQLMTVLYNEVSPFMRTSQLSPPCLFAPLLQPLKTQPGEKKKTNKLRREGGTKKDLEQLYFLPANLIILAQRLGT